MGDVRVAGIDGRVVAPEDALISVTDDGLLRGDGGFEFIKLYDGHPFRLDEHIDRLQRSTAAIELEFDEAALRSDIDAALAAFTGDEAGLRIVVTRGGRRIVLVEDLPEWPASARIALITLTPSEILGGVKSISYAANMQATRMAKGRNADEAVFVRRDGVVLEAPTSSIFWVNADNELRTPSLDSGILDSITRRVVLDGLDVAEGEYDYRDLQGAREAFLASTTREIQPVSEVDGIAPSEPDGGEACAEAARALSEAVAAERAAV
jgi:branched-chain amino acid aminotransferase